jgi:SET domain-containing protein
VRQHRLGWLVGYSLRAHHSDRPNAAVKPNFTDGTIDLYASRDIAPGEEVTIRYCSVWFAEAA